MAKIPSTASGVITKINFGDDEVCPVGHSLFTIELDDGSEVTQEATPAAAAETPASQACPLSSAAGNKAESAPPGNPSSA